MGKSWEQMTQEVVIDGRPSDVRSAALGWEALLKNLNEFAGGLRSNVKDINTAWKGPAYEAFKEHIEKIAKDVDRLHEDATKGTGIVQSLRGAADKLAQAQADFPIPAAMSDEILAARNATISFQLGPFEPTVRADMLAKFPGVSIGQSIVDFFNDNTDDARRVYDRVNDDYQAKAADMPGQTAPRGVEAPSPEEPTLVGGPDTGGIGGGPKLGTGGGTPKTASFDPSTIGGGEIPTGQLPGGPGDGGVGGIPESGYPDTDYGSGLAGAGPSAGGLGGGGLGGLGGGGLGGGGLGGGGLGGGAGGGGLGAGGLGVAGMGAGAGVRGAGAGKGLGGGGKGPGGKLAGGGSLGKPVSPAVGGMMGGAGGAGAGRGQGARGGAGAGRGVGGATAGRGGMAAMGGAGAGAGYGADEASRDTWLQEDEDVWGSDGDAPPGVLR